MSVRTRPPSGVGVCFCRGRSSESKISYDVLTVVDDLMTDVPTAGALPRWSV
ncbi:hypothetical protein SCALM49S_02194 [Streptomyces californicus]